MAHNLKDIGDSVARILTDDSGYSLVYHAEVIRGKVIILDNTGQRLIPAVGGRTEKQLLKAMADWRLAHGLEVF